MCAHVYMCVCTGLVRNDIPMRFIKYQSYKFIYIYKCMYAHIIFHLMLFYSTYESIFEIFPQYSYLTRSDLYMI